MTNNRSSAAIRAELTDNTTAFNAARADAIQFERLKLAAGEAAKLQKRSEELRVELLQAEDREAKARREAAYANIRNMRVDTVRPSTDNGSPLAAQYIIRFERLAYSSTSHRSEWTPAEVNGFAMLAPEQLGFLIDKAPEQIPASIMALAPGNPGEALNAFGLALRRGFVRG